MSSRFVVPAVVLAAVCVATYVVMRVEPSVTEPVIVAPLVREVDAMLPLRADEGSLPLLKSGFPERVALAGAVPLADRPVRRALALFQVGPDDPVLVLGDDGGLRSILVRHAVSSAGVVVGAMRSTSLSADGRTAVFPQPDEVLVVDLTTGAARTVPVPGANVHAAISPDGQQLLVVSGRGTHLVHAADGAVIIRMADRKGPSSYSGTDATACGVSSGRDLMFSAFRWPERSGRTITHSIEALVDEVRGIPVARGMRIAAAGSGGYEVADVIAMTYFSFTPMAGGRPRVLGAPSGEVRPLRWLDDSTLLVLSGLLVLAWNVDTGELHRVMELRKRAEISL